MLEIKISYYSSKHKVNLVFFPITETSKKVSEYPRLWFFFRKDPHELPPSSQLISPR